MAKTKHSEIDFYNREQYELTAYEKDILYKWLLVCSVNDDMPDKDFNKENRELKEEFGLMLGNLFCSVESDINEDFCDLMWDKENGIDLGIAIAKNKDFGFNYRLTEELLKLKVNLNFTDKSGDNFFINYIKRQDSFGIRKDLMEKCLIDLSYINMKEKKSLSSYFFEMFPTEFMLSNRASLYSQVVANKVDVFEYIFNQWKMELGNHLDIRKSIEIFEKSRNKFQEYIEVRLDSRGSEGIKGEMMNSDSVYFRNELIRKINGLNIHVNEVKGFMDLHKNLEEKKETNKGNEGKGKSGVRKI